MKADWQVAMNRRFLLEFSDTCLADILSGYLREFIKMV